MKSFLRKRNICFFALTNRIGPTQKNTAAAYFAVRIPFGRRPFLPPFLPFFCYRCFFFDTVSAPHFLRRRRRRLTHFYFPSADSRIYILSLSRRIESAISPFLLLQSINISGLEEEEEEFAGTESADVSKSWFGGKENLQFIPKNLKKVWYFETKCTEQKKWRPFKVQMNFHFGSSTMQPCSQYVSLYKKKNFF